MLLFIFDVVYLHLSSFVNALHFVVVSSFDFQATLPCHLHSTLASLAREGLHQLWALSPTAFDCLFFFIYREHYGFEWAFFTHRRFLPYALSWQFWHNMFLSRIPWELAVIPWNLQGFILILETQTQPICLFDSQYSKIFYTS